jgi:RHS repeat-associated protein
VTQATNTTESYSYDPVGNRLSSLGVSPYSVNSSNQLTSTPTATYTYDNNGNTLTKVTSAGTTTYGWDHENRLTSVTLPGTGGSLAFKYDSLGHRVQKVFTQNSTSTTTNYLYDGNNAVADVDQNGNVLARYTTTLNTDEPLAELRSGTTSYYSQDGLGSVTSITTSAGAIGNTYRYDSFGNLSTSSGSIANRFQYTAREFDTETGLYYYRARYYDQNVGRFLSEDPLRFGPGDPNFYRYVRNNPIYFRDPTGRFAIPGTNWCGPNWTGVLKKEYNPDHASIYKTPTNDIDTVCMHHDICYFNCRNDNQCSPSGRAKCMTSCDQIFVGEMSLGQGRRWQGIKGDAIAAAIYWHQFVPDPGPNKTPAGGNPSGGGSSCGCGAK